MRLSSGTLAKALALLVIFSGGFSLCAEKILLRNGRAIYGAILERNETGIRIASRLGEVFIAHSQIVEISQEPEPTVPSVLPILTPAEERASKAAFEIQLRHRRSAWHGGDLRIYADRSFDYWNSVGELEKHLGKTVEKTRVPVTIGPAIDWGMQVTKKAGMLQLGVGLSHFQNSYTNRVSIDGQNYIDSFKVSAEQFALIAGTPNLQPVQMTGRVEIGGNFARFAYASEQRSFRQSGFFLSLLLASGVTVTLNQTLSIVAEVGYSFLLSPRWENVGLAAVNEGQHGLARPIFLQEQNQSFHFNANGFYIGAGISIPVKNFLRGKRTKPK